MCEHQRLLIASNRLPVKASVQDGVVALTPATGGLATGLRPVHERNESVWIGWPGDTSRLRRRQRAELDATLRSRRVIPVHLSAREAASYYDGMCNSVLWPLFHYLIDRLPPGAWPWDVYRAVNERFAAEIVREYRDGDLIWIHDYHLLLVPALVRAHLPDAAIGFFLHVPFPAADVFRILPRHREILQGMLGASVIGFHTAAYASRFTDAVQSFTSAFVEDGSIGVDGRLARAGAYPMGVDADWFTRMADEAAVQRARSLVRQRPDEIILLGIDRLDYTKGIPRRLLAYERFLQNRPDLKGRVRLIQVAEPSRGSVRSYQRFREDVDELVGRINGAHGRMDWLPVQYFHQSASSSDVVALYGAADVMLVTPLRDGMNLVAKEFIASRADGDGVLVLSEFAGAAGELPEAIGVNPYDIEQVAAAITTALAMAPGERRARMAALRARVAARDVRWWASSFMRDLADARQADNPVITAAGAAL